MNTKSNLEKACDIATEESKKWGRVAVIKTGFDSYIITAWAVDGETVAAYVNGVRV